MPTNPSGVFTLPSSTWVETGDTVLPEQHNPPFADVEQGMTDRLMRDGRAPMTGPLAMGGNKVTGLGAPTAAGDAVNKGHLDASFVRKDNGNQAIAGSLTLTPTSGNSSLTLDSGEEGRTVIQQDAANNRTLIFAYPDDGALGYSYLAIPSGGAGVMNFNGSSVWTASNDGAGSGLDADLLDGAQGSTFAKWAGGTFTGGVTFNTTASFATQAQLNGGFSLGANANAGGFRIVNLADPVGVQEAVTINYGDARYMRQVWSLTAGAGLTGGGSGEANRTISLSLASLPTITDPTTIVALDGSTQGRVTPANLAAALPANTIQSKLASATNGAVGDTLFCFWSGTGSVGAGSSVSGSTLIPCAANTANAGLTLSGTWSCKGYASSSSNDARATLWQRIA